MNGVAAVPDTTGALHYSNEFLRNALGKAVLSTAHVPPLGRSSHDPLDSSASPLSLTQRHGDLKSDTTSSSTSLTSDAHEGCDRVNSECKVEDGVEREMRGWGRTGKQWPGRVDVGDGRRSQVLQDQSHVLFIKSVACGVSLSDG